jgi:hypothetical protein
MAVNCDVLLEELIPDEQQAAKDIVTEAEQRAKLVAPDEWRERIGEMVDKVADEANEAIQVERRNTYLNQRAQIAMFDYIQTNWADAPARGLQAFLSGDEVARKGSHASVGASQDSLLNRYVTGFLAELENQNALRTLTSGENDLAIRQVVEQLDLEQPNTAGFSADVIKVGQVLKKYNDLARTDANTAGANIGKIPGYVAKQAHDMYRIYKAGFDAWFEKVDNLLDYERTFEGLAREDAKTMLRNIFQGLATGEHVQFKKPTTTGLKGVANIGKRMSKERVLHFKDAAAEHEYAQAFGTGSLSDSMISGLHTMSQNTGLMSRMGPNAELNFATVIEQIKKDMTLRGDTAGLDKFSKGAETLRKTTMPNLTGESRVAGNRVGAYAGQSFRNLQNTTKLGGAVLSSITDIPTYMSEMKYQFGDNAFTAMAQALGGIVKGKTKAAEKEILGMLGVVHTNLSGSATARFDAARDGVPGAMSKLTEKFFKLNGLSWWTDQLRSTFALSVSSRLAGLRGTRYANLSPEITNVFKQFNIDQGKWDIIRQADTANVGEFKYLTPENVNDLPDSAFTGYIEAQGKTPNDLRIRELKREITDNFRSYYYDRASTAVLEPNTRTKATLMRGTSPGTVEGEVLRSVMQFKSFPATFIQRVIKREIYGHGEDVNFMSALKNGKGNMIGLIRLMAWNTLFGYAAMSIKDLVKGREPRTPDNAVDFSKTLVASMLQGGALGIYGDFLFGEAKSRYGSSPLGTMLGPGASDLESVYDIYAKTMTGDDAGGQALNTLYKMVPGNNLFYTKMATDYLVWNGLKEWANPGHTRRMVDRARKENDQEYFLPPSSAW